MHPNHRLHILLHKSEESWLFALPFYDGAKFNILRPPFKDIEIREMTVCMTH